MSITRDLYHLQEFEIAIDTNEQSQAKIVQQLKDTNIILAAKAKLVAEEKKLDDKAKQQKSIDFDIEDLSVKIKTVNRKLYDGKITNSKELTALQIEYDDFQKKRSKMEDESLDLMAEIELIRERLTAARGELKAIQTEWERKQKILTRELDQLQIEHAELVVKHEALLPQILPAILETYRLIKKRKGTGVARVEQGTCRGCRIAISTAELQQAKSGSIVKCNSCGRILYLA